MKRRSFPTTAATIRGQVPPWACVFLIALAALGRPASSLAQTGQVGMAQAPGIVNQAASSLGGGNGSAPGWLYYGVNGADRGFGYRGSYMTLGGFIPYAEDDLGGFWSADLRGHLSTYGGFFSNVGMVRKQFIGGTLLGVGVFWDYDGDQNQYSDTTVTDSSGSYVFAGGQTYNQVGVSGEWLTDWGNLRSNGYIPVGTTGSLLGPFVGNSILCVNGVNAALGGADLEAGVYIPALADWAGMISVGGYAFGNSRYVFPSGTAAVPWFGGVYTRLDMTFLRNWDFSLQANNDSYFDWTGYARLTYRMGGSRRRNVPDQVEQPMMRNEHIARGHQTPEQAINPFTGTPWRLIHVDNSTSLAASGNGTVESPYTTLAAAQAAATAAYDIVFVHAGISQQSPYQTPAAGYTFQADHQYLVGQGTSLTLQTVSCGPIAFGSGPASDYPVITNPGGTAVVLTDAAGTVTGATVDHLQIQGATVGISDGVGLPAGGTAVVNDVRIVGTGANQRGVEIKDAAAGGAAFNFTNMQLDNLTADGFYVDGNLGSPKVNILDSRISNTVGSAIYAINLFDPGRVHASNVTINHTTAAAVYARDAALLLTSSTITSAPVGVYAEDNSVVQVTDSSMLFVDTGVQGTAATPGANLNLTVNNNLISTTVNGVGVKLSTPSPVNGATVRAYVIGNLLSATGDDILLFDGNADGAPGSANLWIKAADLQDLQNINHNATVRNVFPASAQPDVPAPPNYDPTLMIPLPPP
ncbi:MAG: hypothetical protein ACKOZU_07400 [Planctomycetaceae bacterium]